MILADIHCHIIPGVDDGSPDFDTSEKMLKKEYDDGVRLICFTPHYNPLLFPEVSTDEIYAKFDKLKALAAEKFPDLELYLGNELCYHIDCIDSLNSGKCRHLGNGNFVLVDFHGGESEYDISKSVLGLCASGLTPVLAHVERYGDMIDEKVELLRDLVNEGVAIQVNAESVLSERKKLFKPIKRLMADGLIHIISSDAHNLDTRKPMMGECAEYVKKVLGEEAVDFLMFQNAADIVRGEFTE